MSHQSSAASTEGSRESGTGSGESGVVEPESARANHSAAQGQRDPFADDVLERLIRSNQDYQREHGNYIVPLAERLLAARAAARLGAHYENALTRIANHDLGVDYADVKLRNIARQALKESHG